MEGGKKCLKNGQKIEKIFFGFNQISKRDTWIFQCLFKNKDFRNVALVTKKVWAILDIFSQTGLFFALYPTL